MLPILTPEEMAAVDAAAAEPVEVLIDRAAAAVAWVAVGMLGGTYGRRVVVVAGRGNNGNDGRVAAAKLARRGVRVAVVDAASAPPVLPPADLVIDAAYGTGFRGEYVAPRPAGEGSPVLAVDIPSGIAGLTGEAAGEPLAADRTVTFAALKPGLLLADGPDAAGDIDLADIGLDTSGARAHLVEAADVASWIPRRPRTSHKWRSACWVVAGSPGMTGAAHLAARAALRAGSGYVRLTSPGVADDPSRPTEAVGWPAPVEHWARSLLADVGRFGSMVVGPGLGLESSTTKAVRKLVSLAGCAMVVDGDGLTALGDHAAGVLSSRPPGVAPVVLTPHDAEFARLAGRPPGADRVQSVRELAGRLGAVVLLKGSTTVVAGPGGDVLLSDTGDSRLATAGTGDVLSGVIGALLAQGVAPLEAAASGAFIHGRSAALAWPHGLVAGDVAENLPAALEEILEG